MNLISRFHDYVELTKPGIAFMSVATCLAAFVLNAAGPTPWTRLFHLGLGTLLTAAGACTLNMVFEIDVDAKMVRTRNRPLPSGRLNPGEALIFGMLLSLIGISYLAWKFNFLTAFFGCLSVSIYLYVYTPLKKISAFCTGAGAVAGALPPLMGAAAATGRLTLEGSLLGLILFFWQFPHFLSLAWMYKSDYAQAGLHMLPWIQDGEEKSRSGTGTAIAILIHTVALLVASCLPTFFHLTGFIYLPLAVVFGVIMLAGSWGFYLQRTKPKAKTLFLASIFYIPFLVAIMVLNKAMPV